MQYKLNDTVFYLPKKVKAIVKGFNSGKVKITYYDSEGNRQIEDVTLDKVKPWRPTKKPLNVKIKYFTDIDKIEKISIGDWIDLRAAETVEIKKGEYKLIPLGVAMQIPKGFEANIVPRSSTYKKWNILQTNSYGVIDNSYCGDNDQWMFPAYATEDTVIHKNDRICQFRLQRVMPKITFEEVETLGNEDRGGVGSTGKN